MQLDAGIKDPVLVLHNTDSVQLPAFTFATHLFNGEQIRQGSSTMMHNGRDILDNYDTTMFASELSSLPFGITNSVYQSNDVLTVENGGDPNEDPELYKFRITKAMVAGTIVHGTLPALSRCHFGIFDRIVRVYDAFGVPGSEFIGYWRKPAEVTAGKNIYVSVYRREGKCLAVISHIGREHARQECTVKFDLRALGMKSIGKAVEYMGDEDPEYADLFKLMEVTRLEGGVQHQRIRTPIKWGDPGVRLVECSRDTARLELDFHSFGLLELSE